MRGEYLTVDADGHVLEPIDTWERYIDPKFRDRALRVGIDSDGFENLFIDNKPTRMLKGRLGALGGIEAFGDFVECLVPGDPRELAGALWPGAALRIHQPVRVVDALGITGDLGADDAGGIALQLGAADPADRGTIDHG